MIYRYGHPGRGVYVAGNLQKHRLSEVCEEFTTHDVLQDHVNVAWVMEGAEHVHDEWMLQFRQNPGRETLVTSTSQCYCGKSHGRSCFLENRKDTSRYEIYYIYTYHIYKYMIYPKYPIYELQVQNYFTLCTSECTPPSDPPNSKNVKIPSVAHLNLSGILLNVLWYHISAKGLLLAHDVVYLLHLDDCSLAMHTSSIHSPFIHLLSALVNQVKPSLFLQSA